MKAVVVYESMFGNTHAVAEAIADGMSEHASVDLLNVNDVTSATLTGADLIVIGAPTHKHGLSDQRSREQARHWAGRHTGSLRVDRELPGAGIRDFLVDAGRLAARTAVFDTRNDIDPVLSGAAGQDVERILDRCGSDTIARSQSFLVDTGNHLLDGECARAQLWGERLAAHAGTLRPLDPVQP